MSHVVKCEAKILSLEAAARAAEALGMELVLDQKTYHWYGKHVGDYPMPEGFHWGNVGKKKGTRELGTCNHAIRVKGKPTAYEVGLYMQKDGSYGMIWDFYARGCGLQEVIGYGATDANRFIDEYALQVAQLTAEQQGWMVERQGDVVNIHIYDPATQTTGVVEVAKGGTVEAHGFIGGGCQEPTRIISEAIGVEIESHPKPEFWVQTQKLTLDS